MEENFTHDEFEEFLQDQVRNHRMYPNDAVWREIDKKLHGDKKWPALTIAALGLVTACIIISVYFKPKSNIFAIKPSIEPVSATTSTNNGDNILNKLTSSAAFAEDKGNTTILPVNKVTSPLLAAAAEQNVDRRIKQPFAEVNAEAREERRTILAARNIAPKVKQQRDLIPETGGKTIVNVPEVNTTDAPEIVVNDNNSAVKKEATSSAKMTPADVAKTSSKTLKEQRKNDASLATIAKVGRIKNKFSYQIYVAPSRSYRKLLEDRSMLKTDNNSGPVGLNYVADVNNVVRHKPGTGIEAGISFMYNLSDKFRIKSGFQFNVRQYNIEAYRSTTEVASIALIGRNGIDTINRLAVYRNNNGYYSAELTNRYYQLAMPIGVEWEVMGNKTFQFNVAASIQPTYLINRNAYLLSTNFKNYTESPEMVRSWNINSNIETFISLTAGDFKWQLGPQVRYQPYSTFIPEYPIKEHLLDYGIKLGVSKTIGNR